MNKVYFQQEKKYFKLIMEMHGSSIYRPSSAQEKHFTLRKSFLMILGHKTIHLSLLATM